MDDAGAVVGGDEVGGDHAPAVGPGRGSEEGEGPLVAPAHEVGPGEALDDLGVLGGAGLGHDEVALAVGAGDAHVGDVGADGGGHVGDEGPGRGGPDQEVDVAALDGEAHVDRRVDDVAVDVGLAQLVAREGGAAAAAVRRDLVALVEQALVPQLADQPPHRLDVGVVEGPVGVGGVDPDAGAVGEGLPVGDVAVHRLTAAPVELGDAERLDLVLGGEPELLLDLELDGQAVAVPAALAGHLAAAHGLEAGVDVLEHPGPDVVQAGPAVGGGRALVEDPGLVPGAQRPGGGDDVVVTPAVEHPLFEGGQVEIRGDGAERHGGEAYAVMPTPPYRGRLTPRCP